MKLLDTDTGEIHDYVTRDLIAVAPPQWKTPWNHDTTAEANATALACKDESKTQQQFAREADINVILAKFLQTGELPAMIGVPIFQDAEHEFDLQDNMITQAQVTDAWEALPAAARAMLRDPRTLLDYVTHCMATGDLEPLVELGLATKREPSEPSKETAPPEGAKVTDKPPETPKTDKP